MLVISRRLNERVRIGDDVVITICQLKDRRVKIGIEAPRQIIVTRDEVAQRKEASHDNPS